MNGGMGDTVVEGVTALKHGQAQSFFFRGKSCIQMTPSIFVLCFAYKLKICPSNLSLFQMKRPLCNLILESSQKSRRKPSKLALMRKLLKSMINLRRHFEIRQGRGLKGNRHLVWPSNKDLLKIDPQIEDF